MPVRLDVRLTMVPSFSKAFQTCDVNWGPRPLNNVLQKAIVPENLLELCLSNLESGRGDW
jgi:hypothetical protein